jgi:hypothetical protein
MSRARDVASNNLAVDTTPTLQGDLTMGSNAIADGVLPVKNTGTASELRLYCESNNAHYVGLKSPAHSAFSGNHVITMPPNTGNNGEFLSTDGNGVTSWASAGGGAGWTWLAKNDITSSTSYSTFDNTVITNAYTNYAIIANHVNFGTNTDRTGFFYYVNGAWRQGTGNEDYQQHIITFNQLEGSSVLDSGSGGFGNTSAQLQIYNTGTSASLLSSSFVFRFNTRANGGLYRTANWQGTFNSSNQSGGTFAGGSVYRGHTAHDIQGIRFYGFSGWNFARGEWNLYGLAGS